MNTYATAILIGVWFALGVVYDIFVYCRWGNEATLSKGMQWIGEEWPIVIVAYGGLAAHFFCPHDREGGGSWYPLVKPYLLLMLGMLAFRLAWPQSLKS